MCSCELGKEYLLALLLDVFFLQGLDCIELAIVVFAHEQYLGVGALADAPDQLEMADVHHFGLARQSELLLHIF